MHRDSVLMPIRHNYRLHCRQWKWLTITAAACNSQQLPLAERWVESWLSCDVGVGSGMVGMEVCVYVT